MMPHTLKPRIPPKEEKPKTEPKIRGRKSKEEREQWLLFQCPAEKACSGETPQ